MSRCEESSRHGARSAVTAPQRLAALLSAYSVQTPSGTQMQGAAMEKTGFALQENICASAV